MNALTQALLPAPSWGAGAALRRIVAGAHWLRIAHAEMRRAARQRAEFDRLDAHALRDLGMTRDEYLSYDAEARGSVVRTRVRVVDGHTPGSMP